MKPLSETHPTLWKTTILPGWYVDDEDGWAQAGYTHKQIQSCTVDIADHERWKDIASAQAVEIHVLEVEVERLKKELESVTGLWKENVFSTAKEVGEHYRAGIVEGERVAMDKVRAALSKFARNAASYPEDQEFSQGAIKVLFGQLRAELGLDKEEKD